ncbi:MAG: polyprenol monophosphomannose synthase [Candidatus Lernaella stagnicola]|nr:polyprenol monophosphomannose synthase [Candidatus Lernaella stagnicola]
MRTIVTLPTYNEAENIEDLIRELRALDAEVLVADDNSPDGTWKLVEALAATDEGVRLLRRMEKKGRGYAGAEAFTAALEWGADRVIEMDADFSHHPKFIPDLLAALEKGADIVVGSRLVPGGQDVGRGRLREGLTKFSAWYARTILGLPIRDCNSGYRAYTRRALEAIAPATLVSAGPSIVHEVFGRAKRAGLRVVEVPIVFVDRERGESELTLGRLLDGFFKVWRVRAMMRELPERKED